MDGHRAMMSARGRPMTKGTSSRNPAAVTRPVGPRGATRTSEAGHPGRRRYSGWRRPSSPEGPGTACRRTLAPRWQAPRRRTPHVTETGYAAVAARISERVSASSTRDAPRRGDTPGEQVAALRRKLANRSGIDKALFDGSPGTYPMLLLAAAVWGIEIVANISRGDGWASTAHFLIVVPLEAAIIVALMLGFRGLLWKARIAWMRRRGWRRATF